MSVQPSTAPVRNMRALHGWGSAAITLTAGVVLTQLISTLIDWVTLSDFERNWRHPSGSRQEWSGDSWAADLSMVLTVCAAVAIIVWLWRARRNAEALCAAGHRLAFGWVVGAWLCPVVNFWFPQMIVSDVVRASDPATPADAVELRGRPGTGPVTGWWLSLLVSWALTLVSLRFGAPRLRSKSTDEYFVYALAPANGTAMIVADLLAVGALAVSAVFLAVVIVRVQTWQENRGGS
ncbi:DUF4328 domain-containing protein [Nocardia spumae]|uniref:DUF4328 domain-containing protein n=1 Tax=Nocardia spumae TaxID=2887190 RepID=UPI001D141853|nr:DUF4328 domain-containing protein [Nocardia spumae]